MGHPALPATEADGLTGASAPAEPVPVAFLGRTSTLLLQDPVASLNRQLREVKAKLPPGWFIAGHYWDIESGGLDLEDRGHGTGHQGLQVGIPRDGGLAGLLAEAAGPAPRFAAVMCEDIERSGRDTFNALKLERQLSDAGIPLFATDEPINVEGMNATTILVRRVKQGIAEWYRFQLKEKAWNGFKEHTIEGYNIGVPPYGYAAQRLPHPNPAKAAQGRTKTRLALDPVRAPVVAQMFTWRTVDKLGVTTICHRLNQEPGRFPPPQPGGWITTTVYAILANPKYTGFMVYGRHRNTGRGRRRMRLVPPEQWIWSPQPGHPAIITRETWQAAQGIGAEHATSRDDPDSPTYPGGRNYVLRSRCRCKDCNRRMAGNLVRPHPEHDGYIYYRCPHNPKNPRHVAAAPDHPTTVKVREDDLLSELGDFFATRIFGPDRAALLAAMLPANAAETTARREKETATLAKQLRKIDAAENAHAREIETLANLPHDSTAVTALRTRIIARFTELEAERTEISQRLKTLERAGQQDQDPALLDQLPMLGDILATCPPKLKAQFFHAFGIEVLYNKTKHRVTMRATITPSTPSTLAAIIEASEPPKLPPGSPTPADPEHPTSGATGAIAPLAQTPRTA
jgi:site-specific DNA recombinase